MRLKEDEHFRSHTAWCKGGVAAVVVEIYLHVVGPAPPLGAAQPPTLLGLRPPRRIRPARRLVSSASFPFFPAHPTPTEGLGRVGAPSPTSHGPDPGV